MASKEDEERREAAIASTPSLQPNFKPKGVSEDQLSKFRELHRRRLQIKSKSKFKNQKKAKSANCNGTSKYDDNDLKSKACAEKASSMTTVNDSSLTNLDLASKKPRKLHWGLDTKERWEMKANM